MIIIIKASNINLCYQCGKCTAICPVRRIIHTSPRGTIYDTYTYGSKNGDIWSCLTCGLCSTGCPQGIDYTAYILQKREGLKNNNIAHKGVFSEIAELMSVMDSSKVTDLEGNIDSDYGYFPGCLVFLNLFMDVGVDFNEIVSSSLKLLQHVDINPKIMQMKCCGHDLLWQGNKSAFEKLRDWNTDYIEKSGIDTLIVSCAEGLKTFRQDYDLKNIEVRHISEVLQDKLNLSIYNHFVVTYHDPCRLGRHLGIYDAPRKILKNAGVTIKEMLHNRENALCCGVSSMMNCNDRSKALRVTRLNEAKSTGADILITTCPKCLAHFNCLKNEKDSVYNYDFEIMDLSVFLARTLKDGDNKE